MSVNTTMTQPWTKEETLEFIKYAKETYTKEDRQNLEKKLRGSAEHGLVKESNIERYKHGFAKHDDDVIGECVEQLWYSDDRMANVVQEALEMASQSYENVKKKGFKDGLKLPQEVDTQLIATSWKQAFTKSIIKHTIPLIEQVCASRSRDGGLCAISEQNYNYFEPNVLHDIIYKGVGVVNKYVPVDIPAIMREMEMMQFNGVFTKNIEANNAYQNCSTVWLKSEHLMPQHQKETIKAVDRIKTIPFELCKRCKIMLQIISYVRIVLVTGPNAEIRKHCDSQNSGVMFTVLYVAGIQATEVLELNVTLDGTTSKIKLEPNMLIILRNNVTYELKPLQGKVFFISAWITGAK